jgi:hypothetical protein
MVLSVVPTGQVTAATEQTVPVKRLSNVGRKRYEQTFRNLALGLSQPKRIRLVRHDKYRGRAP